MLIEAHNLIDGCKQRVLCCCRSLTHFMYLYVDIVCRSATEKTHFSFVRYIEKKEPSEWWWNFFSLKSIKVSKSVKKKTKEDKNNTQQHQQATKYSHKMYHTIHNNFVSRWLCFFVYYTHTLSLLHFIASFFPFSFILSFENCSFNTFFVIGVCLLHLFFSFAFHEEYITTRWAKILQQCFFSDFHTQFDVLVSIKHFMMSDKWCARIANMLSAW